MQKRKRHPFIAAGILVAIIAVIAFIFAISKFGWDWTGFTAGASKVTITRTPIGTTTATELQPARTLWDWLGLLAALAIPVVVGFGAAWFTAQQGNVSARENTDSQRDTALQAYIDKMSELLLKEHLGELTPEGKLKPEYEEVRKIARVRTLTVLQRLDAVRKFNVLLFLHESGLIDKGKCIIELDIANLQGADLQRVHLEEAQLRGAKLQGADLSCAYLSGADLKDTNLHGANLIGTDLGEAYLEGVDLGEANLSKAYLVRSDLDGANLDGANLKGAYLFRANLSKANLSGANLTLADLSGAYLFRANLKGAYLCGTDLFRANLSEADLSGAILSETNLSEACLRSATITQEQLEQAESLKGTTMPDGVKHP